MKAKRMKNEQNKGKKSVRIQLQLLHTLFGSYWAHRAQGPTTIPQHRFTSDFSDGGIRGLSCRLKLVVGRFSEQTAGNIKNKHHNIG